MSAVNEARSHLVKMRVCNLGCIGPEGVEIRLDEIVCLVGANNTGKSTVLRAYQAAVTSAALLPEEISTRCEGKPATVELWIHIPEGALNIDSKWKEAADGMLLVRSKWTWQPQGGKPVRSTWDPQSNEYAEDGKASGLDAVFNSRLPQPFRIGSLEDPAEEHKKLLELVLEPIRTRLADLMKQEGSPLRERIKALQEEAEKPVADFKADLDRVQARVNTSYRRVFSSAQIHLTVSLGELGVDPGAALVRASHVGIQESHGQTRWAQQGTGSQRALFWSMLEVRSELNRMADERRKRMKDDEKLEAELAKAKAKRSKATKPLDVQKADNAIAQLETQLAALRTSVDGETSAARTPFLPGYMLLIDEPETALHPAAIRAAKEHLYRLAGEAGWQVMLSTHHPVFVDPLKDHTTIVRLHRSEENSAPNVYRTDSATFTGDEKEMLKSLLAFDQSVAEMFFAQRVIIVEGDTEFAAFTVVMDSAPDAFPTDGRPLILRARGKWAIPLLLRMLTHFRVACAVLHDVDAPRVGSSGARNGAYGANAEISRLVKAARDAGISVIHRCSTPDFEREHRMKLQAKDKPFHAWDAARGDASIRASVRGVLDALCALPGPSAGEHNDDGRFYEPKCKAWAAANAPMDPGFVFESQG